MEWINIKESLPEHGDYVLFHAEQEKDTVLYGKAKGTYITTTYNGDFTWDEITHWMPLPEPPTT